ncbi:MAG: MFS transporter [Beijerinckiaceae bacterium]
MPDPVPPPSPDEANTPTGAGSASRLILILGLSCFASTVSMRLVDPLVPLVAGDLGVSLTQAAMLAPIFTVSYALGQPFLGPVADSVGKVRVIWMALACLCIMSLLAAFAGGFESLAIIRALSGIAAGGVIPVALAAVGDRIPFAERQVALSRLLMALVSGQVAGSLMSGAIGEFAGWRMSFLAASLIAAAGSLLTLLVLKPRAQTMRAALDPASVLGRYRSVLDNPKAWRLYLLVGLEGVAVFAVFPFAAELLQTRGAVGVAEAGVALGIFGLGGLAYTFLAPWLVRHLGPARMSLAGGAVLCAALLLLSLPLLPRWTAPMLFGAMGFGFYLIHNCYQTQATELAPHFRSSAVALFACCLFLGTALGPVTVALIRAVLPLDGALVLYALGCLALGFVSGPMLCLSGPQRPR